MLRRFNVLPLLIRNIHFHQFFMAETNAECQVVRMPTASKQRFNERKASSRSDTYIGVQTFTFTPSPSIELEIS